MPLDTRMRFEQFEVGAVNQMAVSAARAVVQSPGRTYDPLTFWGGTGVGKTHLLQAIGNAIADAQPALCVEYLTAEDFARQLRDVLAGGQIDEFIRRWGRVDVLLLDDLEALADRRETQSELLRLVEALQSMERQIVMTSDCPPAEIPDLDPPLVARLAGGLIVEIGPPDHDLRLAILNARCRARGVELEPDVVEAIGRIETGNVRQLQGWLNRIVDFQSLGDEPVRAEDVPSLLDEVSEAGGRGAATPGPAPATL
ncbi:MAG: DnaA ATPase domain-containing protein, partial [Gemmatimonadaceae bacterium]